MNTRAEAQLKDFSLTEKNTPPPTLNFNTLPLLPLPSVPFVPPW
jgi:hypothetical protein